MLQSPMPFRTLLILSGLLVLSMAALPSCTGTGGAFSEINPDSDRHSPYRTPDDTRFFGDDPSHVADNRRGH